MSPKSILKKPTNGNVSQASEDQQRAREIAINHAHIIQHRKDIENQIFEALEDLIDFPLTESVTADWPSPSDVQAFQMLVAPFRPQDFDELILERNLVDKCGYVFCPNEARADTGKGKSRILGKSSAQTLKIVDSNKVSRWCSDECAIRAVHIKAQLNTEPAWLRVEESPMKLLPLTGDISENANVTGTDDLGSNLDQLRSKMNQLALERGDDLPSTNESLITKDVIEKLSVETPGAPTVNDEGMHELVEGHRPKNVNEDEPGDGDWDI